MRPESDTLTLNELITHESEQKHCRRVCVLVKSVWHDIQLSVSTGSTHTLPRARTLLMCSSGSRAALRQEVFWLNPDQFWARSGLLRKNRIPVWTWAGSYLFSPVEESLLLGLHVEDVADLHAQGLDLREARKILHGARLFPVDRPDLNPHRDRSTSVENTPSERRKVRVFWGGGASGACVCARASALSGIHARSSLSLRGKRASRERGSRQVSRADGKSREM